MSGERWVQLRTKGVGRAGEEDFAVNPEQPRRTAGAAEWLVNTRYTFCFLSLVLELIRS